MIHALLLSGAVRAAVVLATGLVAYMLLARAAAATRRFVMVLTLGAAIVVPLAAAVGPRWTVEAPAALSVFAHESANETAPAARVSRDATPVEQGSTPPARESSSSGRFDATGMIILAWLVVAIALLARAAGSQLRVRAIVRRATAVERAPWLDAGVNVKASSEIDSPVVTGLLRPTIVVPRGALDWPLERCRVVLVHELTHARRRDVLVQAIADVACAMHWCNPLVWLCARRLRVECEIAADDAVLAAGIRPSQYAEELVAVATSVRMPNAALAMAERSSLEARVASILASRLARAPLAARSAVAVVTVSVLLAAAVACTSPQGSSSHRDAEPAVASRDAAIQRAADAELETLVTDWSPELATIVVLDPATGEILANAGRSAGKPADVASTVAMAPGSTLKPITIAAALELHAITVDQKFECGPAPRMYGDKALHDASANGVLDLGHLLAVSSNIGTSRIFDALGGDNLAAYLHRFHFGTAPAHIASGNLDGATVAIGEGLTATPLEMIGAYGALADNGVYHAPTLDRGGSTAERVISPETASSVMALLETAVVDETATGKAARVDGVHVAGKTGTSVWTAPDGHDRTYASFIGVAELPSRRVVVLVGIEAARGDLSGGKTAAPVFARLVKRMLPK